MKVGICCSPEETQFYKDAGYDFYECDVFSIFNPSQSENEAGNYKERMASAVLPVLSGKQFFPPDFKFCGPEIEPEKVLAYTETAVRRASACGLHTLVMGSGAGRSCPEGFPIEKAVKQFEGFLMRLVPILEKYDVSLVIEALGSDETSILNTVGAGALMVKKINSNKIKLLADSYHFLNTDKSWDALVMAMPYYRHIHLATVPSRKAPGAEECEGLVKFLTVLKHCGYDGNLSVESTSDKEECAKAPAVIRSIWESIV